MHISTQNLTFTRADIHTKQNIYTCVYAYTTQYPHEGISTQNTQKREAVAEWVRWSTWGRTDVYAWVRTPPVPLSNFVSFAEWLKITYMSP